MRHSAIRGAGRPQSLDANVDPREIRDKLYGVLKQLDEMAEPDQAKSAPAGPDRVRGILKARRTRDRFFDSDLFADPAWDMLLELYAAELAHCRLQVSSLCIGAAVPPTTALRWIKALEGRGLIVREPDPLDGRRIFISLSADGLASMKSLFEAIPEAERLL